MFLPLAMRWALLAPLSILPALAACAQSGPHAARVGDRYEINTDRESSEQSSDGSTGSSSDRDAISARVIAVRDGGVELEYDYPKDVPADDRAATWQLPARVFRPAQGPTQLLNRAELEKRVDPWLKKGGMTRAACGHLIFTWNAFRITCDPDSAIEMIDFFDPVLPELRDGAPYRDAAAVAPAPLKRSADGKSFVVQLAIEPERVRKERAETDLSVAEISRKPLTREQAQRSHADETISGTIAITFELDSSGEVRRRIKVTTIRIAATNGRIETKKMTETTDWHLLPA